jgi:hypothetical protein
VIGETLDNEESWRVVAPWGKKDGDPEPVTRQTAVVWNGGEIVAEE